MKNYSIIGVDVGNATIKTSKGIIFDSKITTIEPLSKADKLAIDDVIYWLGEGEYDTTYRKVEKANYISFLFGALALSTNTIENSIVLGLPLSQFKEDKSQLTNLILSNSEKVVSINNVKKRILINDVEIFPEGVVTLNDDFEGIVVDIGGRTTDVALVENQRGKRKINNPISLPSGTINLYVNFINTINNKLGLDLKLNDAERVLKNGLYIDGIKTDIGFALEIFNNFVEEIVSRLQVEYSLRTHLISLTGGGANLLGGNIKKRLGQGVTIQDKAIFSNAMAYKGLGESIWED